MEADMRQGAAEADASSREQAAPEADQEGDETEAHETSSFLPQFMVDSDDAKSKERRDSVSSLPLSDTSVAPSVDYTPSTKEEVFSPLAVFCRTSCGAVYFLYFPRCRQRSPKRRRRREVRRGGPGSPPRSGARL